MKSFVPVVLVSLLVLSLAACLEKPDYPLEPQLEYVGFSRFDSASVIDPIGLVHLKFTDGDGNVGLDETDISGVFHPDSAFGSNLFISIFRKENEDFVPASVVNPANVRISPRLSNDDDTPIEGDIDAGVYIPIRNSLDTARTVTIRWEIYLVDRDLNLSNVITTPEFVFER